jgi:hypothetical protein
MVHDLRVLLRLSQRKASEPKAALLDSRTPVRATLARLGVCWERAKRWISSPNPEYQIKGRRDRLMRMTANDSDSWAVGFCDETW